MSLILRHQSIQDFVSRFRISYLSSEGTRTVIHARYLMGAFIRGDITETQIKNEFGLNSSQWLALKNRMQELIAAENLINTALGE